MGLVDLAPPLAELLGTLPPGEAIARAYRDDDYRLRDLPGALGCHSTTFSRRLRAFEERRMSYCKTGPRFHFVLHQFHECRGRV